MLLCSPARHQLCLLFSAAERVVKTAVLKIDAMRVVRVNQQLQVELLNNELLKAP